jgi:hypothetical protein
MAQASTQKAPAICNPIRIGKPQLAFGVCPRIVDYPRQESNRAEFAEKNGPPENAAHKAAQNPDSRLAAIVAAWPTLPESVKDDLARRAAEASQGKVQS